MATMEQRIFAPLRESFHTGQGNGWLHAEMNWNPVCLAGPVGAALTVLPDRNDRALFAAAGWCECALQFTAVPPLIRE